MTGAMEEMTELAARVMFPAVIHEGDALGWDDFDDSAHDAVRDMARMLFDAGLLKGSPDDRAWVWMKQAERLKVERDELRSALTEVAPAEIEVEGSFFAWHELPKVLGNHMRSLDESQREAKRYATEAEGLRRSIQELADEFEGNIDWSSGRNDYGDNEAWSSSAAQLRAMLRNFRRCSTCGGGKDDLGCTVSPGGMSGHTFGASGCDVAERGAV